MSRLTCRDVSCGNCQDYMHIGGNVRTCALKIPQIRKTIDLAKRELDKNRASSPQLAALMLKDCTETRDASLRDLAYAIYQDGSAHVNDVLGLIEHLERYLKEVSYGTD